MIGERLSEVRKDHGDTQSSLAKKLNVSVATVRSWEQEKSSPAHEILVNICKMYRVSSDYLLGLSNVDPSYIQRRRLESFTQQELEELAEYERFLFGEENKRNKKSQGDIYNHLGKIVNAIRYVRFFLKAKTKRVLTICNKDTLIVLGEET